MPPIRLFLFLVFTLVSGQLFAQLEPKIRPGKVSPEDFEISSPLISPNTGAVIIADVGSSTVESYEYGWRISFKKLRRIKILNNNGLGLGSTSIFFSAEENRGDKLKDFKAYTFNLKNGKVESTPVSSKDIFLVRSKNSDLVEEKFAFPNMIPGSIIEYSYTIKSEDFRFLMPWDFQGEYPCLWSEYAVVLPDMFNYAVTMGGNLPFYKKTTDSVTKEIWVGRGNMDHIIFTKKWMMKDVPALKEEPFVNCMDSYVSRIRFQVSSYPVNFMQNIGVLRDWQVFANQLLNRDQFGHSLMMDNDWLSPFMDSTLVGATSKLDQAQRLFAFVRDQFHCTGKGVFLHSPLPEILVSRQGNTAEINILLATMLSKRGIHAVPVILSTKDNGLTNLVYPLLDNYNYVICRAEIDRQVYYLDASKKLLGFGRLPLSCYNGHARVIDRGCFPVFFQPDTLHEPRVTQVYIHNTGKDGQTATIKDSLGYYASLDLRSELKDKKQDEYFRTLSSTFSIPVKLNRYSIDSLDQYDQPVILHYEVAFNLPEDSLIYFNPMLDRGLKENPFKSIERVYPVELPSAYSLNYILDMEIPKGYKVDELPDSAKLSFSGNEGQFEYTIEKNDSHIRVQCNLELNKAVFLPETYEELRNFYSAVVKKEGEMIVFRKTGK